MEVLFINGLVVGAGCPLDVVSFEIQTVQFHILQLLLEGFVLISLAFKFLQVDLLDDGVLFESILEDADILGHHFEDRLDLKIGLPFILLAGEALLIFNGVFDALFLEGGGRRISQKLAVDSLYFISLELFLKMWVISLGNLFAEGSSSIGFMVLFLSNYLHIFLELVVFIFKLLVFADADL